MTPPSARIALEATYRAEARRVLATLIRLLGSFEAAEEATHEAFSIAAEQWPLKGIPDNRYAWLVSVGRFKTIDRWRRAARAAESLAEPFAFDDGVVEIDAPTAIDDDELRLIFICCHPELTPDARAALTLREVAGLTTEEIARAYLVRTPTIAQRIVRAKATIRDKGIRYEVPDRTELSDRLDSVLQVIYLIFNEGYATTDGDTVIRLDLCSEAMRLGELVVELLDDSEALGLQAMMLLHEARRSTRIDVLGDIVLLEDQDRRRWDRDLIARARLLIDRAIRQRRFGPYLLQAAIAEVHARAPRFDETDWPEILALYNVLARVDGSPVILLNRAVAFGMRDGAAAGLDAINAVIALGDLDHYHLAFAARADMERRLGRFGEARASYRRALELVRQAADRRFLERRLVTIADVLRQTAH